jgi:hypothetical protein
MVYQAQSQLPFICGDPPVADKNYFEINPNLQHSGIYEDHFPSHRLGCFVKLPLNPGFNELNKAWKGASWSWQKVPGVHCETDRGEKERIIEFARLRVVGRLLSTPRDSPRTGERVDGQC